MLPKRESEALADLVAHTLENSGDTVVRKVWNAMFDRWELTLHDDQDSLIEVYVDKLGRVGYKVALDKDFPSVKDFCLWYNRRV